VCNNEKRKCIFLDRDGVINVDHGYVFKTEDFEFMEDVFPVLRGLVAQGFLLVVITNQSAIGRGYYTEDDFQTLNRWMLERFAEQKIPIAGIYHCPHAPDERCSCRKPSPELFYRAIDEFGIDPAISWMIGDKDSDMQAAQAAGILNRVLIGSVDSDYNTYSVETLSQLTDLIC